MRSATWVFVTLLLATGALAQETTETHPIFASPPSVDRLDNGLTLVSVVDRDAKLGHVTSYRPTDGKVLWVHEPEDKQAFRNPLDTSTLSTALTFLLGKGEGFRAKGFNGVRDDIAVGCGACPQCQGKTQKE